MSAATSYSPGDVVRMLVGPHGGKVGVVEAGGDDVAAGLVRVRPDGEASWYWYVPAELESVTDDGVIRHVPWPVDTGAPRPDTGAHRTWSQAGALSYRSPFHPLPGGFTRS